MLSYTNHSRWAKKEGEKGGNTKKENRTSLQITLAALARRGLTNKLTLRDIGALTEDEGSLPGEVVSLHLEYLEVAVGPHRAEEECQRLLLQSTVTDICRRQEGRLSGGGGTREGWREMEIAMSKNIGKNLKEA